MTTQGAIAKQLASAERDRARTDKLNAGRKLLAQQVALEKLKNKKPKRGSFEKFAMRGLSSAPKTRKIFKKTQRATINVGGQSAFERGNIL